MASPVLSRGWSTCGRPDGYDLYGAKMQGVEANQADFRGADLRLVNFGGAYMAGAMMPEQDARKVAFRDILAGDKQAEAKAEKKLTEKTREKGRDR